LRVENRIYPKKNTEFAITGGTPGNSKINTSFLIFRFMINISTFIGQKLKV
jgi:hypothetical protein